MSAVWRMLWRGLAAAWLLAAGVAAAAPAVELAPGVDTADAWPVARVLADPSLALTLDDVLQRQPAFTPPQGPYANFGAHPAALWLRVPVRRQGGPARWVLEVDYPPLNRIDAYVVQRGSTIQHAVLGNSLPAWERPMRTRAHAVAVDLPEGEAQILLRVHTSSSMIVPVRLHTESAFVASESARQLLQGLLLGVTLALLIYSLAHAASVRDPIFAQYAGMIGGVLLFFVSYTGIGHQHLWAEHSGALAKVAPLGVLVAMVSGNLFVANALRTRLLHPLVHRGLLALAGCAAVVLALSIAGAIDYRATQVAATVLGPIPIVLALRAALVQARRGDRAALVMVVGWSAYALGALCMALLLRGLVSGGFWGQHLFQFCSIVELTAWMQVLSLRVQALRREAEVATVEKRTLQALAHTDALTGLPNRRGLGQAMALALPAARADHALAVFVLDLDGFKPVNDRHGHDVGDELLVQVGRRLKARLRGGDVVARVGGDEFVVLCSGLAGEADAQRLGGKMLDAFREPFEVAGQVCRVGMTIGFALAPHDGSDAEGLLKRADAAMYAGKQAGRNCLRRGGASAGLVSP